MNTYLLLKTLHILSSVVLVGVGFGSAFYMFFANRSRNVQAKAVVARLVVFADWIFTTPAVIIQPVTGIALAHMAGFSLTTPWLFWSLVLYVLAGACWLPVVWLQIRMKQMATEAAEKGTDVPALYWKYSKIWETLGYPAFFAMLVIYYLMVNKPA